MSLRDSYFNGASGLQTQMDNAFQAGIAFIGSGQVDISALDLNDRNGSNLGAGAGNPGLYFKYSSPTVTYAIWFQVTSEIAPTVANATLVQVNILSGDSSTQVAAKIAIAMNAIANSPFEVSSIADLVEMENNIAGVVLAPVSAGTLGGLAMVSQIQAGIAPSGNYSILQSNLVQAAAQGQTCFTVNVLGTGTANASYLRGNNGHNLYLKSFFAGILQAMAEQNIYEYQLSLQLDVSDQVNTNVNFNFNFGGSHKPNCGCSAPLTDSYPPKNTLKPCNPAPSYSY